VDGTCDYPDHDGERHGEAECGEAYRWNVAAGTRRDSRFIPGAELPDLDNCDSAGDANESESGFEQRSVDKSS